MTDLKQASEQAVKAAAYFGKVLDEHDRGWIGVQIDGVVFVAARLGPAEKIRLAIEEHGLFGEGMVLSRGTADVAAAPVSQSVLEPASPGEASGVGNEPVAGAAVSPGDVPEMDRGGPAKPDDAGSSPAVPSEVILVEMWHKPPPEHAEKAGQVHLHVLNDVTLGRRVRKSGECLCSKKHGSDEQVPQDGVEYVTCSECEKVAIEHGLELP